MLFRPVFRIIREVAHLRLCQCLIVPGFRVILTDKAVPCPLAREQMQEKKLETMKLLQRPEVKRLGNHPWGLHVSALFRISNQTNVLCQAEAVYQQIQRRFGHIDVLGTSSPVVA